MFSDSGEGPSRRSGYYDAQQVCERGHQVTATYHDDPDHRRPFCEKCGAPTLFQCPSCEADIQGWYHEEDSFGVGQVPVPEFCHGCGKPYPWQGKRAAAAAAKIPFGTPEQTLRSIFDRFHLVVRQLRQRREDRETLDVQDEYDVQDLLHAVLLIFFEDVREEEWTPSYAGGSARMDFLLKAEQTVIEVKKWRKGHTAKVIGDELLVDIARYKAHPDCKRLVCFVYDPEGQLKNPRALEKDLSKKHDGVDVQVHIRPTS